MKSDSKARNIKQAVFWGLISLTAYLILFINQKTVTDVFSRGGHYAVLVIGTAFVFSFVHGAFSNYLVEVMGFKAVKQSKGGH
ncbi:MAG: hypothetical protein K6T29_02040 [Peptococcaceae bacterium]|nr:hypothetical protein [Peptococcaceae bacterium]